MLDSRAKLVFFAVAGVLPQEGNALYAGLSSEAREKEATV